MTLAVSSQTLRRTGLAISVVLSLLLSTAVVAAPAIRTDEANRVPACVTPERLMAFVGTRNTALNPKYRDLARWYKYWGEAWRVRWDYAFFQMTLETNFLQFRRADGSPGDVSERQNNFAGIGATGGGVPGDRFADVKTGVHAQIQHLVAYSGEHLASPIAPRTQLKQNDIVEQSRRLGRPVTFGDLARRWASDRAYGRSIDVIADLFRTGYCAQAAYADPDARRAGGTNRVFPAAQKLGGPKRVLAGPETLPWNTVESGDTSGPPVPSEPAQQSDPDTTPSSPPTGPKAGAHPAQQPKAAVRTIWSRDGIKNAARAPAKKPQGENRPAPAPAPAPVAAPAPAVAPAVTTVPGTADAAAEPPSATPTVAAAPTEAAPPAPEAEAASDGPVSLPLFKIGPGGSSPQHLGGPTAVDEGAAPSVTAKKPAREPPRRIDLAGPPPAAPVRPAAGNGKCQVLAASFGGEKALLVRAASGGVTQFTVLNVLDGFETSMLDTYAKAHALDAKLVGSFDSKDAALAKARLLCPGG